MPTGEAINKNSILDRCVQCTKPYRVFIQLFESSFCGTKELDMNLNDLSTFVYACFVLLNFCEEKKDFFTEHVRIARSTKCSL